jgi:hypothetical protein
LRRDVKYSASIGADSVLPSTHSPVCMLTRGNNSCILEMTGTEHNSCSGERGGDDGTPIVSAPRAARRVAFPFLDPATPRSSPIPLQYRGPPNHLGILPVHEAPLRGTLVECTIALATAPLPRLSYLALVWTLAWPRTFCVRLPARGMIRWQRSLLLRPLNAAASRRATEVELRRQARFSDVVGPDYRYHIVGCVGPDQTYRASTEAAAHHPCPKAAGV